MNMIVFVIKTTNKSICLTVVIYFRFYIITIVAGNVEDLLQRIWIKGESLKSNYFWDTWGLFVWPYELFLYLLQISLVKTDPGHYKNKIMKPLLKLK